MFSAKPELAAYQHIAMNIAKKIAMGKYQEGERIHGRSTLAGTYNVSPETVRRAVSILSEAGVLSTVKGSGIQVQSAAAAQEFVNKHSDLENLETIRQNITQLMERQQELSRQIWQMTQTLLDANDRFNYLNPITPFSLEITEGCRLLGKTYGEVNFWNSTGATIIAVRREGKTILSPGPHQVFRVKDQILIVGSEANYQQAKEYLGLSSGPEEPQGLPL